MDMTERCVKIMAGKYKYRGYFITRCEFCTRVWWEVADRDEFLGDFRTKRQGIHEIDKYLDAKKGL